jgi:hypothetical protein
MYSVVVEANLLCLLLPLFDDLNNLYDLESAQCSASSSLPPAGLAPRDGRSDMCPTLAGGAVRTAFGICPSCSATTSKELLTATCSASSRVERVADCRPYVVSSIRRASVVHRTRTILVR